MNQSLDLYNGAAKSKSDNDDDTEAPDLTIVNKEALTQMLVSVSN